MLSSTKDNRGVFAITIQRFTTATAVPHKTSFSFRGRELTKLLGSLNITLFHVFLMNERVKVTLMKSQELLLSPIKLEISSPKTNHLSCSSRVMK